MKIAYLFHGHSRTWQQCYQNFFDNVFSVAPGDIYIHTWETVNATTGSPWNGNWNDLSPANLAISQQIINIQGIHEIYKPKIYIVQKNKEINHPGLQSGTGLYKAHLGVKCMLESSRTAFEMACKQDNYDKFVDTRLDVNFLSKFDLNELNSENMIVELYQPEVLFRDLIIIGTKEQLDIKTNFLNHIEHYWYQHLLQGSTMYYEHALFQYCKDHKLTFQNTSLLFDTPRPF